MTADTPNFGWGDDSEESGDDSITVEGTDESDDIHPEVLHYTRCRDCEFYEEYDQENHSRAAATNHSHPTDCIRVTIPRGTDEGPQVEVIATYRDE